MTDGRDVAPKSAYGYLAELEEALPENARITTLSGRYYAMDRDNRWDRVAEAYAAMVRGEGGKSDEPAECFPGGTLRLMHLALRFHRGDLRWMRASWVERGKNCACPD